jgi:hypothetical protein
MTKTRLIICTFVMCMIATPTMADLFDITVINPNTVYTSGTSTFTAAADTSISGSQAGIVVGQTAPAAGTSAVFDWGIFGGSDLGSFLLTMTLSNIDNILLTADAVGSLTFIDIDGDSITADVTGSWVRSGSQNSFDGLLGNVLYTPDTAGETTFDGGNGSVPMNFSAPLPWNGSNTQITATAQWFGDGSFDVTGGSIDAVIVPVPAAVLLGVLGFGVAGLRLRKYA